MQLRILFLLASLFAGFASAASAQYVGAGAYPKNAFKTYKGGDAGHVVLALTGHQMVEIVLFIRNTDTNSTGYIQAGFFKSFDKTDFKYPEKTPVPATPDDIKAIDMFLCPEQPSTFIKTFDLPSGHYEIFAMGAKDLTRYMNYEDISFRFDVTAGQSTYLGEFVGQQLCQNRLMYYPHAWFISVGDLSARDIPTIKQWKPTLGEITVAVPDVASLGRSDLRGRVQ
jgi:hypothetical protein